MKNLLTLACVLSLLAAPVWAQNFQSSKTQSGVKVQKSGEPAKTGEALPPRASGVVIMMSEHGLQVINPLAPKELGTGKKMVTESYVVNPTPAGFDDPKPYGGINIIGVEF